MGPLNPRCVGHLLDSPRTVAVLCLQFEVQGCVVVHESRRLDFHEKNFTIPLLGF